MTCLVSLTGLRRLSLACGLGVLVACAPVAPPAPVQPAPGRSPLPYEPPGPGDVPPPGVAGAWLPQGAPEEAVEAWPGEASTAFRFDAPDGLVLGVGQRQALGLAGGCGDVGLGVLDPDTGTVAADGTLTARRAGAITVFAEQAASSGASARTDLQVAAVAAEFASATRLLPPSGWSLSDPPGDPEGPEASATWLRDAEAIQAHWAAHLVPLHLFDPRLSGSPEPQPPSAPAIGRDAVLALRMWLAGDEADPVVTHRDAEGLHVVVPGRSPGVRAYGRGFHGLFRVPPGPADERVLVWRPRSAWPVTLGGRAPSPATGLPSRVAGAACPPGWAWDAGARPISLDAARSLSTDAQGFLASPDPSLVVTPGDTLTLLARALEPPVTFEVTPAAIADVRGETGGIPMAWSPGMVPPPPGQSVAATLSVRAPGVLRVRARAGAQEARALLAAVPPRPLAWRFRFSSLAPGEVDGPTRALLFRDASSWAAFWRRAFPAHPTAVPRIDFSRCAVVGLVEQRTGHGERGEPVLVEVAPGGTALTVVAPGIEAQDAPARAIKRLTLFLSGRLPPSPRVQLETLCGTELLEVDPS